MSTEPMLHVPAPNLVVASRNFNRIAGRAINRFDAVDAGFQIGMCLEEMAETIDAVVEGTVTLGDRSHLHALAHCLRLHAGEFKAGDHMGNVLRSNRVELLDGFIDLAWVAIGGVYAASHNAEGAMAHVAERNLAKFPGGVVTRDANGKIVKPVGWTPPDLTPFVDQPQE